jgi:cystathionine beta-lyase/cystathionine gamma-synthase
VLARATASAQRRYRAVAGQLRLLRTQALHAPRSEPLVANLAAERASLADRLRAEQSMLAGLLAAPDWQSPAFLSSLAPAAGRQAGRIHAHWNDYKRDRHGDAEDYERRYVERMIDGPPGTRALLTSCGMASFTTILWCLEAEGKLGRPVLAGRGLYHETRTLLERALPGRVRFVDETDTASLLQAIDATRPSALFLDSLSNTGLMPAPDLHAVIECLRGADTYLIVDNTCLSVSCQPLALAGESLRVVVFESLLKYAQLGLDRANAGVIVARRRDAEMLDAYREHLGTNISDVAVHALPPPDRGVLERRLARLERNAIHLAERLNERARGRSDRVPGHGRARRRRRRRPAPVPRGLPLAGVRRAGAPRAPSGLGGGGRGGSARPRLARRLEFRVRHDEDLPGRCAGRVRNSVRTDRRRHRAPARARRAGRRAGRGGRGGVLERVACRGVALSADEPIGAH